MRWRCGAWWRSSLIQDRAAGQEDMKGEEKED